MMHAVSGDVTLWGSYITYVSEELIASITRLRIGKLGTELVATSKPNHAATNRPYVGSAYATTHKPPQYRRK
jgi:hypothetical protein